MASFKEDVKSIIKHRKPKIDRDLLHYKVSTIIKVSDKFKLSPVLLASIVSVESEFNVKAIRYTKGKASDFGLGQIHYKSVKRYNFDKQKLVTNFKYSLEAAATVLKDLKKSFYKKNPNKWYLRYNVGTGRNAVNWKVAKNYCKKIAKYSLNKIDNCIKI